MTPRWRSGFEGVGFVAGLQAEARIARRFGFPVAVGGGTAEGSGAACRALLDQGANSLISFGLAGGLDPGLAPGAPAIPETVLVGGSRLAADPSLTHALGGPTMACLAGAVSIVGTAAAKRRLWLDTNCSALDLESGAVAELAGSAGVAFAVLRAVCDPASIDLPPAALLALSGTGRIRPGRILTSLGRQPGQLASLLRLSWAAARARRTLLDRLRTLCDQAPPIARTTFPLPPQAGHSSPRTRPVP
jgi:adenosylhomocysteine nucleosidase